jgi:hypothetical protein
MAGNYAAELSYSFRRTAAVLAAVDLTPDEAAGTAALARVDALLAGAAAALNQRRYNDAVDAYNQARSLLWTQLYPLTTLDEQLAWKTDLMKTLVSYSAEWLNVLPVEQATAGVRPRELTNIDAPVFGLLSSATDAKGTAALADLELSRTLGANGNTAAAKFFSDRAVADAPDLIKRVTGLEQGGGPPAPLPAPSPAPPTHSLSPGIHAAAAASIVASTVEVTRGAGLLNGAGSRATAADH